MIPPFLRHIGVTFQWLWIENYTRFGGLQFHTGKGDQRGSSRGHVFQALSSISDEQNIFTVIKQRMRKESKHERKLKGKVNNCCRGWQEVPGWWVWWIFVLAGRQPMANTNLAIACHPRSTWSWKGLPGVDNKDAREWTLLSYIKQPEVQRLLPLLIEIIMAPLRSAINIQPVPFDPSILPFPKNTSDNSKLYVGAVDPDWIVGR